MFLVIDHSTAPEPDDIERGFMSLDAIVHLKIEDAIEDLSKRIRFSLGYEEDENRDSPDPPLPPANKSTIELWVQIQSWSPKIDPLSIVTRDYTHTMMKVGS